MQQALMQQILSRAQRAVVFCGVGMLAMQALAPSALASAPAATTIATTAATAAATPKADRIMTRLKQDFLNALWQQDPDFALAAGKFDGVATLAIPNQAARDGWLTFAANWLHKLDTVHEDQLSTSRRTDLVLMRNFLRGNQWYLTTFREFEWNPSQYNIGGSFDAILQTDFAPKAKRVRLAIARLRGVPAYYEAARQSIQRPTIEHTRLAIAQTAGALAVLDSVEQAAQRLPKASALSAKEQAVLQRDLAAARAAVSGFGEWLSALEKTLDPATARSFRIGKALYEGKFAADIQSSLSAEQTYQRALAAKEEAHRTMEKLADQLWPSVMGNTEKPALATKKIALVIDKLSEQHIDAKQLLPEIRRQLPVLQNWIRDHHLVELDPKRPLVVRETPEYQRGVAIAGIEAPGVFRPHDNTYYNVIPLADMTPEKAESFLREYNHWVLQILNIHEAIPGHYVQLQHANRSPSPIKTLFGNGAMVEGWAVYSERMMLESGYGGNTPEMWLMYYKWNLRTICNTILDYSVHVLGMSEAEAKDFLINQAFQTQTEADGKWRRVQYTSVQLTSYFSGYSEILDFRNQLKQQQGDQFDLWKFHEQFLSYGSAPVSMIKRLMMPSL